MSFFEPITLKWDGRDYVIKADAVMEAVARIEAHVTMEELHAAMNGRGIKRVELSRAFGSVLRYAGANVTDEDIYAGMFAHDKGNTVIAATVTLMAMMVPPSVLAAMPKDDNPKKGNRRTRRAATSSSRQHTKRPLSGGISPPPNSGE